MRFVVSFAVVVFAVGCEGPQLDISTADVSNPEVASGRSDLMLATASVGAQSVPDVSFADVPPSAVFHVAPTGNDSSPGSSAQPWRTVGKAVSTLRAGQAAWVHAGTYQERIQATSGSADGTASAPIHLMAAPGEHPVIRGGDSLHGPLVRIGRSYWDLNGFTLDAAGSLAIGVHLEGAHHAMVRNCDIFGGNAPEGIGLSNGASDVAIVSNKIHGYTFGGQDAHGILVLPDSARVLVKGNESWGNFGDSFQCVGPDVEPGTAVARDITIEGNRFHEDHENAVDIKTCQYLTIRDNKFYGYRAAPTAPQGAAMVVHYSASHVLIEGNRLWANGRGLTLGGVQVWSTPVTDVVIRRNLVFSNSTDQQGSGDGFRVGTSAQVRLYNNTFWHMPNAGIRVGDGDHGPAVDTQVFNNIFFDTGRALDVYTSGTSRLVSDRNVAFNETSSVSVLLNGAITSFANWKAVSQQDASTLLANPTFVADPLNNDFFTLPGSLARDRAIATGTTPCGSGPDVGFLESCT